ncbi:hypothetical protein BLNAU_20056 [Blattamonas nauphoetae]|uniref:Uncharacterized protein n=1 Tax=Blattamonas nauphoetae TaxID=2049346 RepID=A0ABQ9X0E7_9EUKA|nr:hypothetical protein BLNAU_20056 [Blattamonas nauphoetae]
MSAISKYLPGNDSDPLYQFETLRDSIRRDERQIDIATEMWSKEHKKLYTQSVKHMYQTVYKKHPSFVPQKPQNPTTAPEFDPKHLHEISSPSILDFNAGRTATINRNREETIHVMKELGIENPAHFVRGDLLSSSIQHSLEQNLAVVLQLYRPGVLVSVFPEPLQKTVGAFQQFYMTCTFGMNLQERIRRLELSGKMRAGKVKPQIMRRQASLHNDLDQAVRIDTSEQLSPQHQRALRASKLSLDQQADIRQKFVYETRVKEKIDIVMHNESHCIRMENEIHQLQKRTKQANTGEHIATSLATPKPSSQKHNIRNIKQMIERDRVLLQDAVEKQMKRAEEVKLENERRRGSDTMNAMDFLLESKIRERNDRKSKQFSQAFPRRNTTRTQTP